MKLLHALRLLATVTVGAFLTVSAGAIPQVPRVAGEVPEAVLPHPAADSDLQAATPRWSRQALAKWGGPWDTRPGLYDHRYVTW